MKKKKDLRTDSWNPAIGRGQEDEEDPAKEKEQCPGR